MSVPQQHTLMSYANPVQYPVGIATQALPASLAPSSAQRPIAAETRIVAVPSSGGDQSGGGLLNFNINAGNATYIKSGSVVLRFRLTPTIGGGGTGGQFYPATSEMRSAASALQRLTILAGGQVIESIGDYGALFRHILTHGSSAGFVEADWQQYAARAVTLANGAGVDVSIPVLSGCLNGNQDVPAWLLQQFSIQFDLAQSGACVIPTAPATTASYVVSNAQLVYEAVQVPEAMATEMRQRLQGGEMYPLNYVTYQSQQLANAATVTALMGLASSSLRGVLYARETAAGVSGSDTQTKANLYLDGRLINSASIANDVDAWVELNRTLGRLGDPNVSSPDFLTRANYSALYFLGGISCQKTDQAGFAFSGSPVNQAVLELACAGTASTLRIWAVVDRGLLIDGSGNVRTVQ